MLKNYKELKVWQKSYELCLEICRNRKNVESADKVFRKQTLESLDPLLQLNWRRTTWAPGLFSRGSYTIVFLNQQLKSDRYEG
jgi:hypothetical protein